MKKTILLSVFLCWAFGNLLGQNVWKKKMNSAEVSLGFMRFHTDGEHYFFSSQRNFVQYDPQGTITGFVSQDATSPIWMDVRKKHDASTGHPYFWILRYNIPSQPEFTVAAYRPGVGIVNERTFADTLTEINNWNRLHIVDSDDSAIVVVGQSFYRKIRYSESSGFVEEWARPLNLPVTAALSHNGLLILSDESGVVTAFDADGGIVWAKNLGMAL
ncbi:MAG: hypothetical protein KF734_05615 [Saprospiraceae bacterium]|nr:hypothetical protein [Saprospiraceae bacterium]